MTVKNNVKDLHGLRVVVMPGSGSSDPNADFYYQSAFETWKLVWKETLLEVDGSDVLFSDHFTRQDYFVAIFHGPRCAALCCFRRADLSRPTDSEDSWFKPWPKDSLQSLGEKFKDGVVVSWLTIHPDYRKTQSDDHLKEMNMTLRLCEVINFFLQDCKMEVAYGMTRNNRSVNKMAVYTGFSVFKSDILHHGISSDLITMEPDQVIQAQHQYPQTSFTMWEKRTVYLAEALQINTGLRKTKARAS